jgi:hypothetical protein
MWAIMEYDSFRTFDIMVTIHYDLIAERMIESGYDLMIANVGSFVTASKCLSP